MTVATGLYQRIRASMERAIWSIGLNQSHRTRQSVPAWRAAQGSIECDCQRRSSAVACLRCAFRVISDKGAPVTCAGRGRTCTCAVPIVYLAWTCGLSRGSRVRRPLQEGAGQRPGRRFGAPHAARGSAGIAPVPAGPRRYQPGSRRYRLGCFGTGLGSAGQALVTATWRRSWPREASWKPRAASQFLIQGPSG